MKSKLDCLFIALTVLAASFNSQLSTAQAQGIGYVWTPQTNGILNNGNQGWYSVASSADGTKLVAGVKGGQIYTSIDSGTNWTAHDTNRQWYSAASSSDGTKLVAVDYFGSGTGDTPPGSGLDGLTQYAASSAMSFVTQAGFASGSLNRLSITSDGKITGGFTNGQSRILGQFVLGNFKAPDQLSRKGGSLYTETPQSGPGTLGTPATADRGSVTAGTLEQSNVDIAQEFINMIAAQRTFEANSKTLTTADQLLSDLMQIRR